MKLFHSHEERSIIQNIRGYTGVVAILQRQINIDYVTVKEDAQHTLGLGLVEWGTLGIGSIFPSPAYSLYMIGAGRGNAFPLLHAPVLTVTTFTSPLPSPIGPCSNTTSMTC